MALAALLAAAGAACDAGAAEAGDPFAVFCACRAAISVCMKSLSACDTWSGEVAVLPVDVELPLALADDVPVPDGDKDWRMVLPNGLALRDPIAPMD